MPFRRKKRGKDKGRSYFCTYLTNCRFVKKYHMKEKARSTSVQLHQFWMLSNFKLTYSLPQRNNVDSSVEQLSHLQCCFYLPCRRTKTGTFAHYHRQFFLARSHSQYFYGIICYPSYLKFWTSLRSLNVRQCTLRDGFIASILKSSRAGAEKNDWMIAEKLLSNIF